MNAQRWTGYDIVLVTMGALLIALIILIGATNGIDIRDDADLRSPRIPATTVYRAVTP